MSCLLSYFVEPFSFGFEAGPLWVDVSTVYTPYLTQFNEASSAYKTYQDLLSQKALKGFSIGGYTGDIPANAIAGFVHGKEHVLDSNVTSQINQIGSVTDMVNQYMNQNFYEKMNQTFIDIKNQISGLMKITTDQANEIKNLRKETEFGGIR